MTLASDDSCQDSVEWVSDFDANGSTCTLNALQVYHYSFQESPSRPLTTNYFRASLITVKTFLSLIL